MNARVYKMFFYTINLITGVVENKYKDQYKKLKKKLIQITRKQIKSLKILSLLLTPSCTHHPAQIGEIFSTNSTLYHLKNHIQT